MIGKLVKCLFIVLAGVSAAGLIGIYLIQRTGSVYDGRYVYTEENSTRIIDVKLEDGIFKVKYIMSGYIPPSTDQLLSSYYNPVQEVNYGEYEFEIPTDIIPEGVKITHRDIYSMKDCYIYLIFAGDRIYFSDDYSYAYLSYLDGSDKTQVEPITSTYERGVYEWNYAPKTGYDMHSEIETAKCIFVGMLSVSGTILAFAYIRCAGKTIQIAALAVSTVYCAAAYFIFLAPSYEGIYETWASESADSGGAEAQFIDYGESGILMAGQKYVVYNLDYADEEEYYDYIVNSVGDTYDTEEKITYFPIYFGRYGGKWYNEDGVNIQTVLSERVTANSVCELSITFDGLKLVLYDDVREVNVRCDFYRDNISKASANVRYLLLAAEASVAVTVIMGFAKRSRDNRLNPPYPYGQYAVKGLVYVSPDMEYMRKYLEDNMKGCGLVWRKDFFAFNGRKENMPVYEQYKGKNKLSVISGMKHAEDITVNRIKSRVESYMLAYNSKRMVLASVIDDKVVSAYEMEVRHE